MGETKDSNVCREEQCAHFIEKEKLHFYRKKFIWLVVIFSIFCIGILGWLVYDNSCQKKQIVQFHAEYVTAQKELLADVKTNKGIAQVNENILQNIETEEKTIESLLQLQTNLQHSQFTLLSIWTGILMIVFLVFSLYSMFKTDELVKQARESIDTIGNSKAEVDRKIQDIDTKVETEVERIKTVSNEYIGEIKKQIQEEQSKVSKSIQSTGEEVSKAYAQHKEKLAEMQQELQLIVRGVSTVVAAVNRTGQSEQELPGVNEEQRDSKSKRKHD